MFFNSAIITSVKIEESASTSNTFEALGSFSARKKTDVTLGISINYQLSDKDQLQLGFGASIQNFEFGFDKQMLGAFGVNSTSAYGIDQANSRLIFPFDLKREVLRKGNIHLKMNLGFDTYLQGPRKTTLYWKNSGFSNNHPDNMAYFAFLETTKSIFFCPKTGVTLSKQNSKGRTIELAVNYLFGIQKYMNGQFTYLAIRPIEFNPQEQGNSTDYLDYFGVGGGTFNDQYSIEYNGNQLQISFSYLFSFKKSRLD